MEFAFGQKSVYEKMNKKIGEKKSNHIRHIRAYEVEC